MATHAAAPRDAVGTRALPRTAIATAAGLLALIGLSALIRLPGMGVGFWIDEGLSVGIADRPLWDIPGILRLDGSPPVYYMLLNLWMGIAGRSEEATHGLSLLIALATIPLGWWLVRTLFGERAGWIAAAGLAINPFLTTYSQETRMYALVVALGVVVVTSFVAAFAFARGRRWAAVFGLALTAQIYTHNWALFAGVALGLAWLALTATAPREDRRRLLTDGAVAFGLVAVLYAPWIPSLLFQTAHTGAPWARRPGPDVLWLAIGNLLGTTAQYLVFLGAGLGFAALARARRSPETRAAIALVGVGLLTLLIAWVSSQANPAWATRYQSVALAPVLIGCAVAVARAGVPGLAVCALIAVLWAADGPPQTKSNAGPLARWLGAGLRPGDLVVSTQPEQVPVLHYYLSQEVDGLRWGTLWGPLDELGVTDWRDGVERMERLTPERDLAPLLDTVEPGGKLVLIEPRIANLQRWSAPWTRQVRLRSDEYRTFVQRDPRFRVTAIRPPAEEEPGPNPVRATVFVRVPTK